MLDACANSDAEPTIRCNAAIAVAKCALYLPESVRDKVVASSLQKVVLMRVASITTVSRSMQALKDPYPRARCAGLSSLAALADSVPAEVLGCFRAQYGW